MKKIIMFLIGCIGVFLMTDVAAIFPRLLTASKTILSKRTYCVGRLTQNESTIQQELQKRDQSIQELELELEQLKLKKDLIISIYEKTMNKPFNSEVKK